MWFTSPNGSLCDFLGWVCTGAHTLGSWVRWACGGCLVKCSFVRLTRAPRQMSAPALVDLFASRRVHCFPSFWHTLSGPTVWEHSMMTRSVHPKRLG
jgi:hypothetical protein